MNRLTCETLIKSYSLNRLKLMRVVISNEHFQALKEDLSSLSAYSDNSNAFRKSIFRGETIVLGNGQIVISK